ncbi:MAG: transcription antitermination factor NusB [Flavobacteriales bacterium]|nr:transcription antitermination factor NusB [Flavobacteriales bacterium]
MLNRRQIRIKAMQILFAYYSEEKPDIVKYEKILFESFDRFRDLYIALLLLPAEMQAKAIEKIEAGMNKKLPTKEDLHPNTKFVTNTLVRILANSKTLDKASKEIHIRWKDNDDLLRQMFKTLIESSDYKEYMASKERGFEHDREYLLRFIRRHIVNFELMHDWLEEIGIFWNDDLDLASSMALKTLKTVKDSDDDITLMPLWKADDDEEEYTRNIFRKTITLGEASEKLIAENAPNWDADRIALMDMVILKMALAEAQTCESIPLKVTMNEYIELANYYSTPKSNVFINGLLETLFGKLQAEGKFKKMGRGLIETSTGN